MSHIAAISECRAHYRHKRARGQEARGSGACLKRRISDAIYRQLVADQQRADLEKVLTLETGPGGHCGASQLSSAAGSHPHTSTSLCTERLSRAPLNFGGGLGDRQAAITLSS
jgi:hypothetical protein